MQQEPLLVGESLEFSYYQVPVLKGLDLILGRGEAVALIGPNGSGKTTLLKLLCGLLRPQSGWVKLAGRNLTHFSRRQLAQRIAMVPQELNVPFSFTVWEMAMLGRTPYSRGPFGNGTRDEEVVEEIMELTGIVPLANRLFGELSGGERQKVIITMALAQEPELLLLDEPTVHLDINHQMEILELILGLNRTRGLTVLATMHDLNLAALYFHQLIMLDGGQIVSQGAPQEVISLANISRVFQAQVELKPHPTRQVPQIMLLPWER